MKKEECEEVIKRVCDGATQYSLESIEECQSITHWSYDHEYKPEYFEKHEKIYRNFITRNAETILMFCLGIYQARRKDICKLMCYFQPYKRNDPRAIEGYEYCIRATIIIIMQGDVMSAAQACRKRELQDEDFIKNENITSTIKS